MISIACGSETQKDIGVLSGLTVCGLVSDILVGASLIPSHLQIDNRLTSISGIFCRQAFDFKLGMCVSEHIASVARIVDKNR